MSLWLFSSLVFKWSPGFVAENLLFQRCQRSFWQSSYHSMSNCSSSRNDLDFFFSFSQSASKQKPPPLPSLICLGRVPLGGGSAWTERALPEDYRMRGGEMSECICVCVHLCVMDVGCSERRGFQAIFSQNAAIVPEIEQCRAVTLIFQSIHYLLCIYLSLSHKEKKICVKKGPFMWRGFLTELYTLTRLS